jgi:hypothetical protein
MTYETPEVRDFGSIAEHTYGADDSGECFPGASGGIVLVEVPGLPAR